MDNYYQKHFESIEKALKAVGLRVEEIVKQGNKTAITVFRYEAAKKVKMSSGKRRGKS